MSTSELINLHLKQCALLNFCCIIEYNVSMQKIAHNINKLSPPDWQNVQVGNNYFASFEILNSKILHIIPNGEVENFDIHLFYKQRGLFIKEYFGISEKFVELKNYGHVKGIPNKTIRDLQTKYFLEDNRCIGFCGYNSSFLLRSLMRLGIRVHNASYPITIVATFGEAYSFAMSLMKQNSNDKGWVFENPKTGFVANYSVLPGNMLFLKLSGNASEEDNEPSREILVEIFKDEHIKGPRYIRIADYTELKGGSLKSRKKYIEVLNSIHQEFNIYPERTYVIGANNFTKAGILFARRFLNFNIHFVDSLEAVLNEIKPPESKKYGKIAQEDIDDLVEHIGSIAWNLEYTERKVPDGHPFTLVYDSIALVKNDFDNLFEEQKKKENELKLAKDRADKANKLKNEFLASITHEIRTPINTILGFSSLLKQKARSEKEVKQLDYIMESGSSLLNLLNDLLDLSKIENNLISISASMCNFENLIEEIVQLYRPTINQKKLNIILNQEDAFPKNVLIDIARFRQIMLNLIGNAVKFTYEGEIIVTSSFEYHSENEGKLTVSVKDTGIGMKSEEVGKLFQQFSKSPADDLGELGSGLGLTLTKRLVELLGGLVSVTSIEGKGSIFTVCFGNVKVVNEWYMGGKVSALLHDKLQLVLRNLKIVVVEEGRSISEYLQKMLADYTSSISGLSVSKTNPLNFDTLKPELIILYLNIPIMDAYSIVKDIKCTNGLEDIPIIAVSDNVGKDTDKALNFLGCNEIISVPISYEALANAIDLVRQKKLPK